MDNIVNVDNFNKDELIAIASDIVVKLHRDGMGVQEIIENIVYANGIIEEWHHTNIK